MSTRLMRATGASLRPSGCQTNASAASKSGAAGGGGASRSSAAAMRSRTSLPVSAARRSLAAPPAADAGVALLMKLLFVKLGGEWGIVFCRRAFCGRLSP